ncbi:sensor histidine kinase [Pontibacter sp. H249]|uniref:sensor histidine kinase n=1 Tax=Pontibacter sp. H249 TaxID=3133420 RepID=UPI0030BA3A0A
MNFNHYRLQVLLRVLLLAVTIYLFARINFNPDYRFTTIGLGVAILVQVWLFVFLQDRTNKQFLRFLNSIKYDDFTELFKVQQEDKRQRELALKLNEVMNKFREVRAEKEAHLQYFEMIVQHIGIGIISYKPDGTVMLLNHAAKKLLKVGQLQHVQALERESPELAQGLRQLEHNSKILVPLKHGADQVNLSVHVIELSILGDRIRLASLQNIQGELEEKEMEAWHTLIKVLTHEIMNSVTPIASLSASAYEELHSYTDTEADEITMLRSELADVGQCLHTISRRSDGLIKFVNDFRNLTAISMPQISMFSVNEMLHEMKTLMREQLAQKHVKLKVEVPQERLLLSADRSMIEQVLINLIKNASEAVQDQTEPVIILRAFLDERSRISIEVIDNGHGMTAEALSKIFIPFYSTKKTGSGIGLSLSRQIMRLHKGSISVQSELGKGTRFILRF